MSICVVGGYSERKYRMSVYEALVIMFAFGGFILALLTYIHLTRKK